ncbi:dihydrolipoamide acetyltransferase family protein [Hydrogenophaga sp. BPS33]|uniref:dihydrolipoamide acetyltransferase family protein n=1 Tax=Hydrogenophaga sp. BPS33 TaxID=2651974 RepID=UPI00132009D7|nr:dihydrolipoamide acetyltransferase family protein [Hydrogenophaga sp. BPS33]QHE83890.1 2-oxo acid dehydrogenase subunit E2 [Hydrogenophaga sp. BPS33]
MRRDLLMPKLGLTMTEGTLAEWLVRPGQRFEAGDSLFVIESEKAAIEVPADAGGTLLEAGAAVGQTLAVGTVIGSWDDGSAQTSPPAARPAPSAAKPPAEAVAPAPVPPPTPAPLTAGAPPSARIIASPLARRVAAQRGVDLAGVRGSGPRGRIRAADVPEAVVGAPTGVATVAPANGVLTRPTAVESTIARRLVQSKQQIPHFYLAADVEVSALMALRAELNAAQAGQRFTLNDFLLAAVGRALAELPQVNRVWTDEGILSLPTPDVGIAVNTERGLVVPVLRDAGRLPLSELARQSRSAIERARAGRLSPADMSGGCITVSNAGMHDVTSMTSIINPGQAMILGVGSVREVFRPDIQGQPALCREIALVLSADHRLLDGVAAAQFLKQVRGLLARPLALLVA